MNRAAALRRPLRNLGWLLGSRGVNGACSLLYLALATRSLGLEGFGRFALIVVMAQAISGVASFSTWQAVVRWGVLEGEAPRAAGFAVALDLASVVAGGLVAGAVTWTAPLWLPLPPELRLPAFGLCLASLLAIRSTPTGLLRLHDRYDLAAAAEAAQPATRAVGAVIAALLFPRIEGFLAAWAAAEIACASAHWHFSQRFEPLRIAHVSLAALPRRHPGVWRFVWATNLSRTLAVTVKQVLLLVVGALGGAALAGGFRLASQLGQALVQLSEAVSRAVYPELVRAGGTADLLARSMTALALPAGLFAVGIAAVFGKWILSTIGGPQFAFAHGAMVLLALAGAVELVGTSWDALLVSRGRAELALVVRAVPLLAATVLLPFAIDAWGLAGAAGTVLVASALTVAGLVYAGLPARSGTSR